MSRAGRPARAWRTFRAMPWIVQFGVCLALAILVMLAWPTAAHAEDQIARKGADNVVISETPCTHAGTLIQIDKLLPGERDQFHRAIAMFQGQKYFGCWRSVGGGVHLIYEDGDQGMVPFADFKPLLST